MSDHNKTRSQEGCFSGESLDSNLFMEGLADLIQTSLTYDQSGLPVKDEQRYSFQEPVSHMCTLQEQHRESGMESMDVVQQREVSSSKPSPSSLLNHNVVGPLLLQALDGFLFIVSSDGVIEFASDNISHYLNYSVDDLMGKSIYRFIHPASHQFFGGCLESLAAKSPLEIINNRNFSHEAKFRINAADDFTKDLDDSHYLRTRLQFFHQKSKRMSRDYDFSPSSPDTENQSYLVCIAQRLGPSNERNSSTSILNLDQYQFTTKQDLQGKILNCDSSSLRAYLETVPGSITIREFVGKNVLEFCHPYDKDRLRQHHEEVVKNGTNMSGVYRFQILKGRYVFVQTKSKLFKNPTNNKPEFIMSTHSIVRMCDSDAELKGSAEKGLMQAIIGPTPPSHRESSWMSSLCGTNHPSTTSKKDSSYYINSSMLLPPPDALDIEPGNHWGQGRPHLSRSYSLACPSMNQPSPVTSDQSPQHASLKQAQTAKRSYKRKRLSPTTDVRVKVNCYASQCVSDDRVSCKKAIPYSPTISITDNSHNNRNSSNVWDQESLTGGILPSLQALQQQSHVTKENYAYISEPSLYSRSTDLNTLTVFSSSFSSSSHLPKFIPSRRMSTTKGEGLRALLTASDEDDSKNEYELASIKIAPPTLVFPSSHISLVTAAGSGNSSCLNRSPPQEPQSTTRLGENPNSPLKDLSILKRGQSPGRCNLLMNLLTGATDDEDEESIKITENRNRTSMRILAKLETLQAMPDTSAGGGSLGLNEKIEVESTSENNTLLKALLKSNTEEDKPTKKAEILSKLLSDSSDDMFLHPSTEISSTVGNDPADTLKLFLTSSGQNHQSDPSSFQPKNSTSNLLNLYNNNNNNSKNPLPGDDSQGLASGKTSMRYISTASTKSQSSFSSSLVSAASSSLSFLISNSGNIPNGSASIADNSSILLSGDGRRPTTNANCKLLKELLSTQPAPKNIVHPCRISALPMATPQTIMMKKSFSSGCGVKMSLSTPTMSLEAADKIKCSDNILDGSPSNKDSPPVDQESSCGRHSADRRSDLNEFLIEDNDLDLESILSTMTSTSLDLPIVEDSAFEPLMMSHIEHAIMTADLSAVEIDLLINNSENKEDGISTKSTLPDKLAINEIQQQLMQLDPPNALSTVSVRQSTNSRSSRLDENSVESCGKERNATENVPRTSLMTVVHKQGSDSLMSSANTNVRKKSFDLPMQMHPSSENFGENSLQHFKDMMKVSIAPNAVAPRTSSQMTLGQLLNGSLRSTNETKEGGIQRTQNRSISGPSQVHVSKDSCVPSSPVLSPKSSPLSKSSRVPSLSMCAVPGSLQALHQHHSISQLNNHNNQSSASLSTSTTSTSATNSLKSFKHQESSIIKTPATSLASLTNTSPSSLMSMKNTAGSGKDILLAQKVNTKVVSTSNSQIDATKILITTTSTAPRDEEASHMLPSLAPAKQPITSSAVNARLALKGVLQGRSQMSSNQACASTKISDVSKVSSIKAEDHQSSVGHSFRIHSKMVEKPEVRLEGFLENDEVHPNNASFTFQATSSDLDDLEVIIAQDEKDSKTTSDNQLRLQLKNAALLSNASRLIGSESLGSQNTTIRYNISGTPSIVQLQTPNPNNTGVHHLSQLPSQPKLGYIAIGNMHQNLDKQPQFISLKSDASVDQQFSRKQEQPHKIVLLGQQGVQDKLFHVQMKHQTVPQQFPSHQQFLLQQPVSQNSILLQQPISYHTSAPQQVILSQVYSQQFLHQPKQQQPQSHQLLISPMKVKNVSLQQVVNQQQHQQFVSNASHLQQIQLQQLQSNVFSRQQAKSQSQQAAIIFQQQNQVQQQQVPQLVLQQNAFQQQSSLHNIKPVLVEGRSSATPHRLQVQSNNFQSCQQEQFDHDSLSSSGITQSLFGTDGPDIGNLEDDEIYQLISALSNEESAFCLSQLSEEAMNWADSNSTMNVICNASASNSGNKDNSKTNYTNLSNKSFETVSRNVYLKSNTPLGYSIATDQSIGVDFQGRSSQASVALDSLLFNSDAFEEDINKFTNVDNNSSSNVADHINQPKRHAMLEKLLAE